MSIRVTIILQLTYSYVSQSEMVVRVRNTQRSRFIKGGGGWHFVGVTADLYL